LRRATLAARAPRRIPDMAGATRAAGRARHPNRPTSALAFDESQLPPRAVRAHVAAPRLNH